MKAACVLPGPESLAVAYNRVENVLDGVELTAPEGKIVALSGSTVVAYRQPEVGPPDA